MIIFDDPHWEYINIHRLYYAQKMYKYEKAGLSRCAELALMNIEDFLDSMKIKEVKE